MKNIKFTILYAILFLLFPSVITPAQSTEKNFRKFWNYQNRLRYYVNPASSDPSYPHGDGEIMTARNLYTNAVASYGQQNIALGYYIGVLATQYNLLSNNGQSADAQKTLNELNRILDCLIRKDTCAERLAPWYQSNNYNGFFIRNDIFSTAPPYTGNFIFLHWGLNEGLSVTDNIYNPNIPKGSPAFVDKVNSPLFDNSGVPNPGVGYNELLWNSMSQDEVIGLLQGLALVHKFANGTLESEKASEITDKMIMYIRNGHGNGKNWLIRYPDGSFMDNHHGGICIGYTYGFAKAGLNIVHPKRGIKHYLTAAGRIFARIKWGFVSWYATSTSPSANSSNMHMEAVLGAIGNSWKNTSNVIYNKTQAYQWDDFYALLYMALQGKSYSSYQSWGWPSNHLNTAPCYGPYCYCPDKNGMQECSPLSFSLGGWGSSLRFTHDLYSQYHGEQVDFGGFSGVDYMLLYNLYNIYNISTLPPYVNCSDRSLSGTLPLLPSGIGANSNPQTYNVIHSIESTQIIDNVTNPNPSNNSGNITYRAGSSISLQPGFSVKAGSTFWAYIKKFDICTDDDPLVNQIDEELRILTPPPIDSALCGTLLTCDGKEAIPFDTILFVEYGVPEYLHIDTTYTDTLELNDTTYYETVQIDSTFLINGLSIVTDSLGNFCFIESDILELDFDSIPYSFVTTNGDPYTPNGSYTIEDWINLSPITLYLCKGKKLAHIPNASPPINDPAFTIKVFPNPNDGTMNIVYSIPPESSAEFAIYDITGCKVSSTQLPGTGTFITISNKLNNGVYFYNLIVNDKATANGRLVIIN